MKVKYVARLSKREPNGVRDHIVLMLSANGTDPEICDQQILKLLKLKYPDYEPHTVKRLP